jgi:predicted secreted acid phosphatase
MGDPLERSGCVAVKQAQYPLLMQVPSTSVAIDWALSFLGCMRLLAPRPCIVLDIDGTVLLNFPNGSTKCVLHFQRLCRACAAHGITIFCITARPEEDDNRAYTVRQLQKCAIQPVEHVYMRPPSAEYGSYKFRMRKAIVRQGYSILLTIGDQFADVNKEDMPKGLRDDALYVGQMSDNMQFAIKLPSEFV